jgi:hypothetical protein
MNLELRHKNFKMNIKLKSELKQIFISGATCLY